jgi:hypothetical protein
VQDALSARSTVSELSTRRTQTIGLDSVVLEIASQRYESTVIARFRRGFTASEQAGDLGKGAAVDQPEPNGSPLLVR